MFWRVLFKLGWYLEVSGRYLIKRSVSESFVTNKGLGFPDREAQEIAYKVVTTEPEFGNWVWLQRHAFRDSRFF